MARVVEFEKRDEIAVVTLDNQPVNAINQAIRRALLDALSAAQADDGVKALLVVGRGRQFSAGADIGEFGNATRPPPHLREVVRAFDAADKPIVAELHGVALGGALELAMACHYRVAAPETRLGLSEVKFGIIPGAGGTQRLPRLVGPARAKDLIWSGRQVKADEALAIGLVDRVVPADELEDEALAWAGELASGAVVAMGLAKQAIDGGLDGSLARGLDLEAEAFIEVFGTDDARVGVASFLEHGPGKATFSGR